MSILIYIIILLLFAVLLFWTWNNTKDLGSNTQRIIFVVIGIVILFIITIVMFYISKIGIQYSNKDIMREVRKFALLIFTPINGFISLPHIANIKARNKNRDR